MSILTHTCSHKPLRKIKVAICNQQTDSSLYVWLDVWFGDLQVLKSMVIHDTECPYWDQVSLNNTNPLTLWFSWDNIFPNETLPAGKRRGVMQWSNPVGVFPVMPLFVIMYCASCCVTVFSDWSPALIYYMRSKEEIISTDINPRY